MKDLLKKQGIVTIIAAVVFAILGIIMIANPEGVTQIITTVLSIAIIAIGLIKVITYFAVKGGNDFYNYELVYGIITILIGIAIMVFSNTFVAIIRVGIGIWITYTALMRIQLSLKLKNIGLSYWIAVLILAIITLIAGIYVIFNKQTLMIATGIIMICYSIIDIIDEIIFMRNVDKLNY